MESACRVYRPRDPRKTALWGLLDTRYERVKGSWEERFERKYGYWRGLADGAVARHLDCGIWDNGFARVRCRKCPEEFLDMLREVGVRYIVVHRGGYGPIQWRHYQRQMAELNTNTRYLHDHLAEYALRLTATFPDPLSVCFFVCTGTEANDLALRLARTHTGTREIIVLEHAYHGHTTTLVDVSPYKFDGPGGRGRRPWVHVAPLPPVREQHHRHSIERRIAPERRAETKTIESRHRDVGQDEVRGAARHVGAVLAHGHADLALAVTDGDDGAEAEAPATLDHLGHAVDVDHVLVHVRALVLAGTSASAGSAGAASTSAGATGSATGIVYSV